MTDYLCPNCGPISDDGDVEENEHLFCALCGAGESELTNLTVAYKELNSRYEDIRERFDRLLKTVSAYDELADDLFHEALKSIYTKDAEEIKKQLKVLRREIELSAPNNEE